MIDSAKEHGGILPKGPLKRKVLAKTAIEPKNYDNYLRYRGYTVSKDVEALPCIPDLANLSFDVGKNVGCFFCDDKSKRDITCVTCDTVWHEICIKRRISDITILSHEISLCSRSKKG